MRRTGIYAIGLLLFLSAGLLDTVQARHEGDDNSNNVDANIRRLISDVDPELISKHLFYLAKDPLPYRKLNFTLPGHEKNTLYEADDYLAGKLEACGYRVEREGVRVQAFRRDTSKPKHAQYSPPKPEDPWYMAYNLYAERKGRSHPERIIVVVAHKDSQSWIDSAGANDNAIGTSGVLEMARVLAEYTPESKHLAELMAEVNTRYSIGLEQRTAKRSRPGDDDGSFVLAGFPAAVVNIGSLPYGDPNYHAEGDIPETCDIENAAMTVQATLAAVVTLDRDL